MSGSACLPSPNASLSVQTSTLTSKKFLVVEGPVESNRGTERSLLSFTHSPGRGGAWGPTSPRLHESVSQVPVDSLPPFEPSSNSCLRTRRPPRPSRPGSRGKAVGSDGEGWVEQTVTEDAHGSSDDSTRVPGAGVLHAPERVGLAYQTGSETLTRTISPSFLRRGRGLGLTQPQGRTGGRSTHWNSLNEAERLVVKETKKKKVLTTLLTPLQESYGCTQVSSSQHYQRPQATSFPGVLSRTSHPRSAMTCPRSAGGQNLPRLCRVTGVGTPDSQPPGLRGPKRRRAHV